ncbi:hypothetical protein APHAL10511_005036 [Amanita phalloides]|nr:hypothetical protein APHAL10511_005036 [Amanita phalloides]
MVKLEDAKEEEDDEARATSVPAKCVTKSSKAPRKKMKKEPELRIPELEDPLMWKPSTGCVNKEPASKTIPELTDPPASNNLQVTPVATSTVNLTPASTTTFSEPLKLNELPQNAQPTLTNTHPMLKLILTASTATLNNNTDILMPKTIETNMTDGNSQPDMVKGAPTMDVPSSVVSNVSMMGSSPSISTSVMHDKQPRPRPLTLSLKLPPNLPKDDAASSSRASDTPANDEPCPCPPQDVNKANPITMAGASIPELAPANTSSGTSGKGKPKAAARKGKKAVKEYVVDPNLTVPKDLFTNDYLANPDNVEKTKAVDILRAWKALSEEERQGYTELSREMKRERKGEK